MLSRIFWVGIAGVALLTGMVLQDGGWFFDMAHESDISAKTERAIDRAVDRSVDHIQVTGPDGREMNVDREAKRALAAAVGQLVEAEADLAVMRIRDASEKEMLAGEARRAEARAEVDRLKAQIKIQDRTSAADSDAIRAQVERDIRDDVRETVRDAVRN
jgi:hypothetical protein